MRRPYRIWALCALALSTVSRSAPTDAEPPLRQLTQTDFSSSIANGLWYFVMEPVHTTFFIDDYVFRVVEFFSPYCIHCKAFGPTWRKLVTEESTTALGFSMAQVNCIG